MSKSKLFPTATHWGNFLVDTEGDTIVAVHDYANDPNPSPIGQLLRDSHDPNCRIDQPMVRKGYLEHGMNSDTTQRGRGSAGAACAGRGSLHHVHAYDALSRHHHRR